MNETVIKRLFSRTKQSPKPIERHVDYEPHEVILDTARTTIPGR